MNKGKKNTRTESTAAEFFKDYLKTRYGINDDQVIDIRSNTKEKEVNADIKLIENNGEETFFEIKSTRANEKYWGRIIFKEILDALNLEKNKKRHYYFVIIKKGGTKGFQFIYPKDAKNKPYLTLDEMLRFTNKKESYGIDFTVKYKDVRQNAEKDLELNDVDGNDHFDRRDIERKKEIYLKLIAE